MRVDDTAMPRTLLLCAPALAGCLAAQSVPPAPAVPPPEALDWKDLTKSGIPIKFYGFLRMDAYYNTARANSVILPATVLPENGTTAKPNDDQFAFDPRLTRFGVDVLPAPIGDTRVTGKLEIDFANFPNGSPESRPTPRMRLGYIDIDRGDYGFRIGQDWDTISPLYPAVNHELLMWNAGNLGDRRAQMQARYDPEDSSLLLEASLGLTGAINNQDLDPTTPGVSTERDGFDYGLPHVQARIGWKDALLVDDKPADLGLWGAFGRIETDTAFGGETRFDTWTVGVDVQVPLSDSLTLRGEGWIGENLGDFRGCIGQTINITTGEEIASIGGWAELVLAASSKTKFHLGATTDNPENDDLGAGAPTENLVGYVGTVHDWDCGVRTGFDVLYWETDWVAAGIGNMVRFNLYFQYDF